MLPFVFVFNPLLLLIGVHGRAEVLLVAGAAIVASLAFAAATMGSFRTRCRAWEVAVRLGVTFALFRPDFVMDLAYGPDREIAPGTVYEVAEGIPADGRFVAVIEGSNIEGEAVRKTVGVRLGELGEGRKRLADAGLTLFAVAREGQVARVRFGSRARKSGFEEGVADYRAPRARRTALRGLGVRACRIGLLGLWLGQGRRARRSEGRRLRGCKCRRNSRLGGSNGLSRGAGSLPGTCSTWNIRRLDGVVWPA